MNEIRYKQIGLIHSPYKEPSGTPIQPTAAKGVKGTVEVFPKYVEGLKDINGFSHIILIYHFHLAKRVSLKVRPYMDDNPRGIFATRAPPRPNSIGFSIVRLIKVEGNILHIQDVDIGDETPLLDIKPYVPEFDLRKVDKTGWIKNSVGQLHKAKDNGRFV